MTRLLAIAAMALGLCACGPQARPVTPEQSAALVPAEARLAALYETSCKTCHTIKASGAPLSGDAAAWAPRLKQGMPTLVGHTVQGFKAMPAGGQCAGCTAADYEALIHFMSGAK
ncbi:MAG: c-type cytochrome [Caulobacter sp.]|nr:c-type cytochrome [Caulobacter sp.]